MTKRSRKNTRKIRNLIIVCVITSFVLVISTYAWFIGMRTVNVDSFDVKIAVTDSLLLSLDGNKWNTTVDINSTNFKDASYEGNANTWSEGGLIPVSSVGEMDTAASRMMLYEKGSLTATKGGYRLMASRMKNNEKHVGGGATGEFLEERGYVAFDLFVKNFSGRAYYTESNPANEEAIYLTTDSKVTVSESGGVGGTGIENSVRVAFAQIGRVNAETNDPGKITGIISEPTTEQSEVTGINRRAQIWEPNELSHVKSAVDNFNETCRLRNGVEKANVFGNAYSTTSCEPIIQLADGSQDLSTNTLYVPTYAINKEITNASSTDIYDGLNGYMDDVHEANSTNGNFGDIDELTHKDIYAAQDSKNLFAYKTFTDADKMIGEGESGPTAGKNERPTFITLAPNSITKIRVYIYIEGQDVDNFDLASIGKRISVQFGLTKDRYDFNDKNLYKDNVDTTAPVIAIAVPDGQPGELSGSNADGYTLKIDKNATFDPKVYATATDVDAPKTPESEPEPEPAPEPKSITDRIVVVKNNVTPETPGNYLVTYSVSDESGNYTNLDLKVVVKDPNTP